MLELREREGPEVGIKRSHFKAFAGGKGGLPGVGPKIWRGLAADNKPAEEDIMGGIRLQPLATGIRRQGVPWRELRQWRRVGYWRRSPYRGLR
jgi:hypothetical protein